MIVMLGLELMDVGGIVAGYELGPFLTFSLQNA